MQVYILCLLLTKTKVKIVKVFRRIMPIIQQLPDHLINQIAAGEVVERPASVVKELVENAIDADAKKIVLEITGGGDNFLRITDDGKGMDHEDALMALQRHATSKIATSDDLFKIHTLGFRGEALASIASVSYLTLQTKERGALEGSLIQSEGGKMVKNAKVGCPEGTQIEVRQLFYNTPARKKYLKSEPTEFGHITDVVAGAALAHPSVSFKVLHDEKVVLDLPAHPDDFSRIRTLLGRTIADDMVPVFYGHSAMKLSGFIGKPLLSRSNRDLQYLFINHRYVHSHVLSYAVKQAYHSLMPKEKHPIFVLYFELDPEIVDVNVHPRKAEVRFRNEREIFSIVSQASKKALESFVLAPKIEWGQPINYHEDRKQQPLVLHDSASVMAPSQSATAEPALVAQALHFTQEIAQSSAASTSPEPAINGPEAVLNPSLSKSQSQDFGSISGTVTHRADQLPLTALAQFDNSYILCSQGKNLVLVDQHAAHERIMYTKLMKEVAEQQVITQPLLTPHQLDLPHKDAMLVHEHLETLRSFGIEIEPFGGNTFMVHAVPSSLQKNDIEGSINGLIQQLNNISVSASSGENLAKLREKAITYLACRSAVKFGDPLAPEEQKALVEKLLQVEQPYTCPHGRPSMIIWTQEELLKRFGRYYS